MADRAILFVDGNNWYHGLKGAGVRDQLRLDWVRIAQKLAGPRIWLGTRYYVGKVKQHGNEQLYADQRKFVSSFLAADKKHSVHYGRLEARRIVSPAAIELRQYVTDPKNRISGDARKALLELADRHHETLVRQEKAVDVMLAVDMVTMACSNEYETAYLLSADGDYTHAAQFVRSRNGKVFAVAASSGNELSKVVNSYIRVDANWFTDLYHR